MNHIGIDCGGTSTDFLLTDDALNTLATLRRPSVHMTQVSKEAMAKTLLEGVRTLLEHSGIGLETLNTLTIGMAGYGESRTIQTSMDAAIEKVFPKDFPEPRVVNDALIAHAGALKGKDGVLLIAGTGSIAILKENGVYKRTGGWGPLIGDEGGGYWMGKALLNRFSKMADGRMDKTPLYDRLKAHLGLENDYDLIARIHRLNTLKRTDIAALASWIKNQADDGDAECMNLFEEAAGHLAHLVNALASHTDKQTLPLALTGGVFKSKESIMNPLKKHLDNRFEIQSPEASPTLGAILLGIHEREASR